MAFKLWHRFEKKVVAGRGGGTDLGCLKKEIIYVLFPLYYTALISNFVNVFSLYCYQLPLEKGRALH